MVWYERLDNDKHVYTIHTNLQPSHKRPPPESEPRPKDGEQGDPPEENHSLAQNVENIEDEGLGSETRLDRPSSAKGYRRREADIEAAPQVNGIN